MAIIWQAEDGIEPVSDSIAEQFGNIANYNVLSGCAPTYSAAAMTVALAAGVITHNGLTVTVAVAAAGFTLVSDSSNPRWTWLCLDSAGSPVVVSGDPLAVPTVPELGDRVAVALVKVNAAATIANDITYKLDKRIIAPSSGLSIGAVWFNVG